MDLHCGNGMLNPGRFPPVRHRPTPRAGCDLLPDDDERD